MSPSERDEIIALVTRLQEQIAELMAANEELRRQLAESHRNGRRQAAPFSKGKRSSKPKRPGRKPMACSVIDATTQTQIQQSVGVLLRGFLAKHDPSDPSYQKLLQQKVGRRGELKPFHEALLTPAISTISRYERSFSTTLGSMFEVATADGELVGKQNFTFAQRQYQVTGQMGTATSTTIDSIRNEIETVPRRCKAGTQHM